MDRPTLPLSLARNADAPLAVQLATQLRAQIASGRLPPGRRLPSNRALATDLGVSRTVVEHGYDQLIAEGWLTTRRGAGTYVAEVGRLPAAPGRGAQGRRARATVPALIRLDTGTPWVDPRHEAGWRRAWREVSAARMPPGYPDPAGTQELRVELAGYVSRTRGVVCGPENLIVTAGTTHGLALLLGELGTGSVAVEDPGYQAAVAAVAQSGRTVVDVPVDDEGIDVDALRSAPDPIRAVYVTPAHQHPLGMTMSAGRRVALLAEATRRDAVVVEDDYDSEFRYDVAPLPALASLDAERVVCLGTASKSVHPALRIGWLVGPAGLVAEIAHRRASLHDHPSWPLQRAFLVMLREGHVDRRIRSARRVYAERCRVVSQALAPYGQVTGPAAGMYLSLLLHPSVVEAVHGDCRRAGFAVASLATYSRSSELTGVVIGFGGVTDAELDRALTVMVTSLGRARRRP